MFMVFQEATLPKLSQTSLYIKFNESNNLTAEVVAEINQANRYAVNPETLSEIISLMKLNGDPIVKKAVKAYQDGDIIILDNKETSKIPPSLPYIVLSQKGEPKAYIFANTIVNKITSPHEYTSLMATLEAAYLALMLYKKPDKFVLNRQLLLTLCDAYTRMTVAPLENKLYMKGENLTKATLYTIAYFYKIIDAKELSHRSIPYKKFITEKIDESLFEQIVNDVNNMPDSSFMSYLDLIIKINPVRYKDLKTMYMTHFVSTCGTSLVFALENLGYLFLLITSANYKTPVTSYNINRYVGINVKKALTMMASINF